MIESLQVCLVGIAISVAFFWILILFRITDIKRGFGTWTKLFLLQGIIIAWALKIIGII